LGDEVMTDFFNEKLAWSALAFFVGHPELPIGCRI